MKYDFTSVMDRSGRDAIAVDNIGLRALAPGAPMEGCLVYKSAAAADT